VIVERMGARGQRPTTIRRMSTRTPVAARSDAAALPPKLLELLREPSLAFLATTMRDGSPQLTEVWVDTDGERVLVNSVTTHLKVQNIRRDPRVAITIADPSDPSEYFQVRGRVAEMTTDGAADHIEELSRKYLGAPYPWYGGRDQVRILLRIEPEHVSAMR
jgi:PPOX class probable F420-dependent enzyme